MELQGIADIANKLGIMTSELEELVTLIVQKSVQEALRMLPQVMQHIAQQTDYIGQLTTKFYQDNKDLVEKNQLVGSIIEHLESQHPGMSYEQLLSQAAILARQKIQQLPTVGQVSKPNIFDLDKRFGEL
jgi:ElaB/YqjD/DUF883 family membrane-anchored ribosome-binding protein